MLEQARRCKECVDEFATVLREGPPKEAVSMGTAAVCWQCGHVGLPRNAAAVGDGRGAGGGLCAVCGRCGSDAQTNLVRVRQRGGGGGSGGGGKSIVPWIDRKVAKGEKSKASEALTSGRVGRGFAKKTKPNEKCPCGSGKKFKKCCGAAKKR